jgi:hypothetical protein
MDSITNIREPFKKKILVSNTIFGFSKYLALQYDTIFKVRDGPDWTMILTYLTYAPKPLLVITEDIQIPDGLWAKLGRGITLVNITSMPVINIRNYDSIFFSTTEELNSASMDYMFKALQSVYRATYTQKENKEINQELRVAGAGIVWTKVEEQAGGNLYWYDPVENNQGDNLSNKQMSELFSWLSGHFSKV